MDFNKWHKLRPMGKMHWIRSQCHKNRIKVTRKILSIKITLQFDDKFKNRNDWNIAYGHLIIQILNKIVFLINFN